MIYEKKKLDEKNIYIKIPFVAAAVVLLGARSAACVFTQQNEKKKRDYFILMVERPRSVPGCRTL